MADVADPTDANAPGRLRAMLPGVLVGFALALTGLSWGFISGLGTFWRRPENDYNAYLVAWQYFLHDRWRLPLFDLPAMGYPEGGSVLFNYALPLGVLPSKLIYGLTGLEANPFGIWILVTYLLLGGFASRLLYTAGVRLPAAILVGAFLAVGKILFIWRLGHVAISGHFVIVWALTLYVENTRDRRFTLGEHFVLCIVTLLTNAYLLAMVGAIEVATVLTLIARRQFSRADAIRAATIPVAIAAVAFAEGYGAMFRPGPASMRAGGFGHFSWNLSTLLIPMAGIWGPSNVVRDATGGQYQGDGYLGGGVVLLATLLLVMQPIKTVRALREHWVLAFAIVACALFAASDHIYLGSRLLVTVPAPEAVLNTASFFRASGRFIWVLVYAVTVFAMVGWERWFPRETVVVGLVVFAAVNAVEMRMAMPMVTLSTSARPPDPVDGDQFIAWLSAHERLFQFPAYSCGGLVANSQWGGKEANRELRIQLMAARLGRPSNSVYTSRQLKDCGAEFRFGDHPELVPGTLYMITKAPERMTPQLAALVGSPSCLDAGYGFICSAQPLTIASAVNPSAQLRLQPAILSGCPGVGPATAVASWTTQSGETAELHVGAPDGPVVGAGATGTAEIQVLPGTNLYLMPAQQTTVDAIDVETVYQAAGECGASQGGRS